MTHFLPHFMRQKESRFAEQPAKEAHNACPHHIRYGDKRVEKTSPLGDIGAQHIGQRRNVFLSGKSRRSIGTKKAVRTARLNSFFQLQFTYPIALHIRDSTLHFLQCPSRRPTGQGKRLRRHSLSPSCRPGISSEGYSSAPRLYLVIVRQSPTYSSFIPYHNMKVKPFL